MLRNPARHTLAPIFLHFCVNGLISDFLSGPLHIGLVYHDNLSYPRGVLRGIKQMVHSRPQGILGRGFRRAIGLTPTAYRRQARNPG